LREGNQVSNLSQSGESATLRNVTGGTPANKLLDELRGGGSRKKRADAEKAFILIPE